MAAHHISALSASQPSSAGDRVFYTAKFTVFAASIVHAEASAMDPAASMGPARAAFHTVKRTESGKTYARPMGAGRML
jgi:hypothetical protein